jgi:CRP-like cAMP-binding protein
MDVRTTEDQRDLGKVSRSSATLRLAVASGSRKTNQLTQTATGSDTVPDKRSIFARHEFFRGLPSSALDRLAFRSRTVAYPAGTAVFRKGEDGHGLLAVLNGTVKISILSEEGKEIVLNLIGVNEVFGEIALLDGLPRTADASALTDCELLVLDRRDFIPILSEEPAIALKLLEVLSGRLRRTSRQVEDISFIEVRVRLARALLRLAEVQGTAQSVEPRIAITQRELGQMIGLSRESTNRHLRDWQERGMIAIEKGTVLVLRPANLQLISNSSSI